MMGLPIFIAPVCWDIYPRCTYEQTTFNMFVHTSLFLFIPLILLNLKIILDKKLLINIIIFLFYSIVCLSKNSLYSFVLLFSLSPIIFGWGGLNLSLERINYKYFLYAAAVGSIASLGAYLVVGGEQYLASLVIYSYLNYWNDYMIILWLISFSSHGFSNKSIVSSKMEFLLVFVLISGAVLLSASRASIVFLIFAFIGFAKDVKLNFFHFMAPIGLSLTALANDRRLNEKFESVLHADPVSGRGDIWESGFAILAENPIFGVSDIDISSLHSTWVDIFVIFGLSSVFLFTVLLISIRKLISNSIQKTISLGLIGFFLGPFSFNVPLRQLNIFFALFILISLALSARRNFCAHSK